MFEYETAALSSLEELCKLRMCYLLEDHGQLEEKLQAQIAEALPGYFSAHLSKDLFAFICRNNGEAVACCMLYVSEKPPNPDFPKGKTGTVLNVYTDPGFRRQGIAERLMKMLTETARELDLDYIELKATEQGYQLYRKIGFKDAVQKYHNMKLVIER